MEYPTVPSVSGDSSQGVDSTPKLRPPLEDVKSSVQKALVLSDLFVWTIFIQCNKGLFNRQRHILMWENTWKGQQRTLPWPLDINHGISWLSHTKKQYNTI